MPKVKTTKKHHPNTRTSTPVNAPILVHGFSDGGFLEDKRMATGSWTSVNNVVTHAKGAIVTWKSPSNNVAEYWGLIHCLETALDKHYTHFSMNMDSLLVVQQVLGHWHCKNPILIELLQYVRCLADQFAVFAIQHTLREGNTVADALCNLAFDGFSGNNMNWLSMVDKGTAAHEVELAKSAWEYKDVTTDWYSWWSIVMEELKSVGPMLRNLQLPSIPIFKEFHTSKTVEIPIIGDLNVPLPENEEPIWQYVIGPQAVSEMKLLAKEGNIPWDSDRFKLLTPTMNKHGVNVLPYPLLDSQYTTIILEGINWDLPRLIKAWRGQTESDPRPNKSLDFSRIAASTVGYDDQRALETLINDGYGLHWTKQYHGVRPLPKNQPSADANAEIMGAMILKQYKQGRLMVMDAEVVAAHVPAFATSPYGCVAKANKPLTQTCRPIHNQSAPRGVSINDGLDESLRPDATWPGASHIADRIITASKQFGAETLKAFVTDITDAFIQIGLTADDVQVNGGILPRSNIATLATSCVFGNCESPAAFKILNCVPHIHRQSGSYINGVNTPFDIRFYVDDGNAIEPDIGERLHLAEASLRRSVTDVFGPKSIQEDKTSSWASSFTSLGYSWDLPSGTVSIPEEKLLRVKNELLRFSSLKMATITEFRSLVGKLRHVATCCKPAGALMQLLGGGLSSHKVVGGRQKRHISPLMRSELQWWASFLTPARFHNLPVEWLGKRTNLVSNWLHCYSQPSVGVWIINQSEGSLRFTPWVSSLLVTVLTCIQSSLVAHSPSNRMTHTRIIINECFVAKTLNRGSSPSRVVQDLLKSIGIWQLDHRHRISATTPSWERSPPLSIYPCIHHSNHTNSFFQIYKTTISAASSPPLLLLGKPQPLPRAQGRRIYETLNIGSCFVPKSTYRVFGSMNSLLKNRPQSWRGSLSIVGPTVTTRNKKGINGQPTATRRLRSNGHIVTIETPSCISTAPPSYWWKLPISAIRTAHTLRNHALPKCCSAAMPNSSLHQEALSRGGSSSSSISFSEEVGNFGLPTMQEPVLNKPSQITAFNGMTSSSKIVTENQCIGRNQKRHTRSKSPLIMQRQIRQEEETLLPSEHLVTPSYVPLEEPSSHSEAVTAGSRRVPPTRSQVGSRLRISPRCLNAQPRPKASIRRTSLDTQSGLDMPPPSLTPAMTNLSSGWQEGGLAKQSLATPASLVRSC